MGERAGPIVRAAAAAGQYAEARVAYHAAWPLLVEQGATADPDDLRQREELLQDEPDELGPV